MKRPMKRPMKRIGMLGMWTGAVALAVLAGACSDRAQRNASDAARDARDSASDAARTAADKAGKAADKVGGAIEDAGRAGAAAIETVDVKAALMADDRVDAGDINVDTDHTTKTVTLKGRVPTAAQKTIAEEIATRKAVGYRVHNELTVGR